MSKERSVIILGEEIPVQFCMAVEIAYEEIANRPFSMEDLDKRKYTMVLNMAAILTAKPETGITLERLLKEARPFELTALTEAVTSSMLEWYDIPAVMQDDPAKEKNDQDQDQDDDDQPGN